jgi:hypothetical protein
VFKFKNAIATLECKKLETEKGQAEIIGGNPGTDKVKDIFKECSLSGKTVAECGAKSLKPVAARNAGELIIPTKTVLTYPEGEKEGTRRSFDAVFPQGEAGNENLFTESELTGTNCGALFAGLKVKAITTGTELELPIFKERRKCGVLGELGEIDAADEFAASRSGAEVTVGALEFPATAIKKAEVWEPVPAVFKKIECTFEASGAADAEVGVDELETEPAEPFGWKAL